MKLATKDMTRVALFASLICIASLILKMGGDVLVPFSLLPFMVMLAGGILGPRLGALSVAVYVLVGLMGVPVFAKPPYGGFAYILQPTFGFLPGFIAAAYAMGWFLERVSADNYLKYMAAMLLGIAVYYIIGIPYLYAIVKFYLGKPFSLVQAIQIGMLPFIGLDILKGLAAGLVARGVQSRLVSRGQAEM